MTPTLSIVTITYRDPEGLAKTLRSLEPLADSDLRWEHIVVDGSPELTAPLLAHLPWKPRHLIAAPRGIYEAMNLGVEACQGELVWLLNGGDALKSVDTLRKLVEQLVRDPSLAILCAGADMVRDGRYRYAYLPARTFRDSIIGRNRLRHQAMLYRRSALVQQGPFSTEYRVAAEYEYHLRCLVAGLKTRCVRDRLVVSDDAGASSDTERTMEECGRIAAGLWRTAPFSLALAHQVGHQLEVARVRAVKAVSRSRLGPRLQPLWLRWNRRGDPGDARPVKVLILGQTPPPHHGQAMMIDALVSRPMSRVARRHVRMDYARDMAEIGKPSLAKAWRLVSVTARALVETARFRPDVVYYPPASPALVPVLRDVATLLALRPFIGGLILHFHAAGLGAWYQQRGPLARALLRRVYFGADAAIVASRHNPADGDELAADRVFYVPLGVEEPPLLSAPSTDSPPEVLFVGAVTETKGAATLVAACASLWHRGMDFTLSLVGHCSPEFADHLRREAGPHAARIKLWGVLTGDAKWRRYREAAVFCFPSFYPFETFGLVCLEAMACGLPVIAARWRATPEIVIDGETGLLVAPRATGPLTDAIRTLLDDPSRRHRMGLRGRERYLSHFTLDRYVASIEDVFVEVAQQRR